MRLLKDPGSGWNQTVKPMAKGADRFVRTRGDSADSLDTDAVSAVEEQPNASGPYHTVLIEERIWTANWINQFVLQQKPLFSLLKLKCTFTFRHLADDAHLKLRTNPIDTQESQALYKRCQDGILLWFVDH